MEQKQSKQPRAELNPIRRPSLTKAEIYAIKSLQLGSPREQLALETILNVFCDTYGNPYRTSARQTDICIGKMTVGQFIVWCLNTGSENLNLDKAAIKQLGLDTEQDNG